MTVLKNSWTLPGAGRSVTADHQFSQPLPGCSPLQWIHDLEGCWWGRGQALAAWGLLQCSRSGGGIGGLYRVQGVTSPPQVATLTGRVETTGWTLWPPWTASQGRDERRGLCAMSSADHTEPWARLDGRAPLAPKCPHSLLSAQALHVDTCLCVVRGCVCCTKSSQRVWTFTLLSCSVMSCCLGGHGQRAAADQTGGVWPLPSFPPRLSAQTRRRPRRPLLVWSVRGVSWVPPALPLLGAGCSKPPVPRAPLLLVPCEDLQIPPRPRSQLQAG